MPDDGDLRLTYRQADVLALLALGLTAAESGRVLDASTSTVEHERTAVTRKLGAKTLAHVVGIAYETRLLPLEPARRERLAAFIRDRGGTVASER